MENPLTVLLQIARVFEDQRVAYVVVGSFASSLRGLYRTTNDVDLVADIKLEQVRPLVAAFEVDFYIDENAARRAVTTHGSFNIIHFDSVFKADIFVPPPDDFSRQQLMRRQPEDLASDGTVKIYVATAEDTILAKLRWYRLGNEVANTQWTDVMGIIGTQGQNLDLVYLREWAEELRVLDLLEKALEVAR